MPRLGAGTRADVAETAIDTHTPFSLRPPTQRPWGRTEDVMIALIDRLRERGETLTPDGEVGVQVSSLGGW